MTWKKLNVTWKSEFCKTDFLIFQLGGAIMNDEDDETTPIYDDIPRGYLQGEYGKTASCCHLYALLKEKKYRRAFVTQLLSTFDDFNEHLDHILYIGMVENGTIFF